MSFFISTFYATAALDVKSYGNDTYDIFIIKCCLLIIMCDISISRLVMRQVKASVGNVNHGLCKCILPLILPSCFLASLIEGTEAHISRFHHIKESFSNLLVNSIDDTNCTTLNVYT